MPKKLRRAVNVRPRRKRYSKKAPAKKKSTKKTGTKYLTDRIRLVHNGTVYECALYLDYDKNIVFGQLDDEGLSKKTVEALSKKFANVKRILARRGRDEWILDELNDETQFMIGAPEEEEPEEETPSRPKRSLTKEEQELVRVRNALRTAGISTAMLHRVFKRLSEEKAPGRFPFPYMSMTQVKVLLPTQKRK